MTGRTVALNNGTVLEPPVHPDPVFTMALETEGVHLISQKELKPGKMRRVAGNTLTFKGRLVLYCILPGLIFLFLMAGQTYLFFRGL
jgi:hypothetical protein